MTDKLDKPRTEADAALEREIRDERKFTLAEAIGRLAGPGCMKGESPATLLQQGESKLANYLQSHLTDAGHRLELVVLRHVMGSELLLHNLGQPMIVLASYCQTILGSEQLLKELVRQADVEWGRMMLERPYFQQEGSPAHADDPYTYDSVRKALTELLESLSTEAS